VKSILTAGYAQTPRFSAGQIRTSNAADPAKGLGWKDNGDTTTIGYAFYGDANLDGVTNSGDFSVLATNFNTSGKNWIDGDFNYDGKVNALDFNALATNYCASLPSPALGTLVPEPTSLMLLLSATAVLPRTRRRSSCTATWRLS